MTVLLMGAGLVLGVGLMIWLLVRLEDVVDEQAARGADARDADSPSSVREVRDADRMG